jgi:adenylate kinase family enzyme
MIIVVEGPDNAGKTTLALLLAKRLKAIYVKTEFIPPERGSLAEYSRILEAAEAYGNGKVISDRYAAVSDPLYGPIVRGWTKLDPEQVQEELSKVDAFVYCRPPDGHMLKTMNVREQMDGVTKNANELIRAYDLFFQEMTAWGKVWRYDWSKDDPNILAREIQKYV